MLRIALIAFSFIQLASCQQSKKQSLPYYNDADFTPLFLSEKQAVIKIKHQIGAFQFWDQNGMIFDSKSLDGKIHVANFFFTGCGSICPNMMNNLKVIQNKVDHDTAIQILSFSVTPWSDSVKKLKEYADLNRINHNNWKLLTGSTNEIYNVARKFYFAEESLGFTKDSTDFLHTEHVLLVDRKRKIRGIYNGTIKLDMEQLIKDIEVLMKE